MQLFVGLGNPGARYARNRHNIGFMAVDEIVHRHAFGAPRSRFQGRFLEGEADGERVLVLKPETFMNESGRAVQAAVQFYKLQPDQLVVFHDELDLAAGKIRAKRGGGYAGHNGLKSIGARLGPEFRRVRLGIGHPGEKGLVHGHVLHDFAKADEAWLRPLLEAIAEAAGHLARGDDAGFTSRVALLLQRQAPERRAEPPGRENG